VTPVTRLRTFTLILCVTVLLVCAVSAGAPETAADGSTTLRASTSASGSPFAQGGDVPDALPGAAHPSWMGSIVLLFGGLLAGLWLFAGILSFLRVLGDARLRPETKELPPFSNRTRTDETPVADWL
jgi:hypothetical protein